jgi:hypothetical protein
MRSLKDIQLLTSVLVDADYPDGAIINETVSQAGTAVINEVYNDVLVNLYKLLSITGNTSNGVADSESTTYQILGALQKLPNVLNDIRQTMTLALGVFSVPIAIDLLPDGYFLIVKPTSAGTAGATYSFKGTGALTYDFISPGGFNAGDTVLLIINHPTNPVQAFSINQTVSPTSQVTKTAADLLGSDPFFYLPLTGTLVPVLPKYLTMYIKNGDGDNQTKMISPAYVADTRIITGMPSPTDWPSMEIILNFA